MKKFISKKFHEIPPSAFSGTAGENFSDLINFTVGDPDLNTNEIIINDAFKAALDGMTHYTNPRGLVELREEIINFYKDEFDFNIGLNNIQVTISGCEAMTLILHAILNEGDEVIIPTPYFTSYKDQVEISGGKCVFLKTTEEDNFLIDENKLESLITEKTKALIVNTPNNPTGACLSREKLKNIYEICKKHDILVICDDIYMLYSYEEEFFPMVKFDEDLKNVIVINSFSKDYVMTGWRIGYIVAHEKLIDVISHINESFTYSAPTMCQVGAISALRNRQKIQPQIRAEYEKRMFLAYERLKKLKNVKLNPPRGTFYLFPDVSATGLSSKEVAKIMLEKAHVKVIDGALFGEGGDGHLRLAVTVCEEKLNEAFDRLEKLDIFK